MKNIESNITNLTSLWKTVLFFFPSDFSDEYYECVFIKNTQWPNRIWAKNLLSIQYIEKSKDIYKSCTFSHFFIASKNESLQNNPNFKLKSVQYGMSLPLDKKFKTERNLVFKIVENEQESQIWSDSFYLAFRYRISSETIKKTKVKIPFYLVYFEKELIGTVILYTTNKISGIHSLGILPQKRKQGFATEIMHHVLNKSIDGDLSLATLQASEMAKEMYVTMGFTIDFLMENYQLK